MSIHSITTVDGNETNLHFSSCPRDKSRRSQVEYIVVQLLSTSVRAGMNEWMNEKRSWALRSVVVLAHRERRASGVILRSEKIKTAEREIICILNSRADTVETHTYAIQSMQSSLVARLQ